MMRSLVSAFLIWLSICAPAQATMVQMPGQGYMFPGWYVVGPTITHGTGSVCSVAAATQKCSFIGRVYQKDVGFRRGNVTKNLVHVSFGTNNITCAGCTSTLQVDVQGVSVAAGPPGQPDGVIAGGGSALSTKIINAGFSSFAWMAGMPNFTAPAVVHYGDLISVNWSFATYDSGQVQLNADSGLNDIAGFGPNIASYNGTSWSGASSAAPNITLEFDDGSIGALAQTMPYAGGTMPVTLAYNSASSPNEVGMQFSLPFNSQVDQICAAIVTADNLTTGVIELTDTSLIPVVLASVAFDGHQNVGNGGNRGLSCFPIPVQSLTRNKNYVVGLKATSASAHNVTSQTAVVGAASSKDGGRASGQAFTYTTRTGTGKWAAPTNTQLPYMAIIVSALDDGTGPGRSPVANGL